MKRYLVLLLAFVLMFSVIGIGTAAADVEPDEASAKCFQLADKWWFDLVYDGHGDCVSHYNANNLNWNQDGTVWLCKAIFAPLFHIPVGQCVSAFRS
jgi:hypothetical protein